MTKINEIFKSIQGEGYWTGRQAIFIRFAGCNRKCHFCDTDHSPVVVLTPEQIAGMVADILPQDSHRQGSWDAEIFSPYLLVLTGGEPSLQTTQKWMASFLHALPPCPEFLIAIETNGDNPIGYLRDIYEEPDKKFIRFCTTENHGIDVGVDNFWVTLSPKSQAAERGEDGLDHIPFHPKVDEVKLVADPSWVDNRTMDECCERWGNLTKHFFLQPMDCRRITERMANLDYCTDLLERDPRWRLSLQMHKIIKVK